MIQDHQLNESMDPWVDLYAKYSKDKNRSKLSHGEQKRKFDLKRSCPESNRGYSEIQSLDSEPNVMTTTLHDLLKWDDRI